MNFEDIEKINLLSHNLIDNHCTKCKSSLTFCKCFNCDEAIMVSVLDNETGKSWKLTKYWEHYWEHMINKIKF